MSHFTVAVLSHCPDDVERLLEPFNENTYDPDFLEHQPAQESMQELRENYESMKGEYTSFEDFLDRYYGYQYNEELDEAGYVCNPRAKWDWWTIGGRWPGLLRLKDGGSGTYGPDVEPRERVEGFCDQAKLRDVDLSPDPERYAKGLRFWEVYVEGGSLQTGETPGMYQSYFNPQYFIEQYHDKETYARSVSEFSVWALITPDGEWHEQGQMGWFGLSDATFDSRKSFMEQLQQALVAGDPELYITIVDCHI